MQIPTMTPVEIPTLKTRRVPNTDRTAGTMDFGVSCDNHNHTVFKIPGTVFIKNWQPWMEDKEDMNCLIYMMGGPISSEILKVDLDVSPTGKMMYVTIHTRLNREATMCLECGEIYGIHEK